MTGTTTVMLDVADAIHGLPAESKVATRSRLCRMSVAVLSFALGARAAALLFRQFGMGCFIIPPVIAVLARFADSSPDPRRKDPQAAVIIVTPVRSVEEMM